ncbi:MAG: arginine repressor [Bacilli bacterium]
MKDKEAPMIGKRRKMVLELISQGVLRKSQTAMVNDLAELAKQRNLTIDVSQATVSRDLRELGVVWNKSTKQYELNPTKQGEAQRETVEEQLRAFVESGPFPAYPLVLKTTSGFARAVAVHIEGFYLENVVGTLSADDTLVIFANSEESRTDICKEIGKALGA